jgi:hypothetical protein
MDPRDDRLSVVSMDRADILGRKWGNCRLFFAPHTLEAALLGHCGRWAMGSSGVDNEPSNLACEAFEVGEAFSACAKKGLTRS